MKKIILLLSTVILVFLAACEPIGLGEEPEEKEAPGEVTKEEAGFAGITKQQCINANGYWNECGSPCAGTDADFCIQMCQVQCECDDQEFTCPEGFKCRLSGKIADEMGVCIKK
jgi:hypothetical protein